MAGMNHQLIHFMTGRPNQEFDFLHIAHTEQTFFLFLDLLSLSNSGSNFIQGRGDVSPTQKRGFLYSHSGFAGNTFGSLNNFFRSLCAKKRSPQPAEDAEQRDGLQVAEKRQRRRQQLHSSSSSGSSGSDGDARARKPRRGRGRCR